MADGASTADGVTVYSALQRADFIDLSRAIMRRQSRVNPFILPPVVVLGGLLALFGPWPFVGVFLILFGLVLAGQLWRQPYRLWSAQEKLLTSPGTVTFDGEGVRRLVPGRVDVRVPWPAVEGVLDTGRVVGLRIAKYSWIMVPLSGEVPSAERVRDLIAAHAPTAAVRALRPGNARSRLVHLWSPVRHHRRKAAL